MSRGILFVRVGVDKSCCAHVIKKEEFTTESLLVMVDEQKVLAILDLNVIVSPGVLMLALAHQDDFSFGPIPSTETIELALKNLAKNKYIEWSGWGDGINRSNVRIT